VDVDVDVLLNELDLLLLDGRMSQSTRDAVRAAYLDIAAGKHGDRVINAADPTLDALHVAQKLVAASPEFHATNIHRSTGAARRTPAPQPSLDRPLKTIVVLELHGGADSFNMLVPHSKCTAPAPTHAPTVAPTTTAGSISGSSSGSASSGQGGDGGSGSGTGVVDLYEEYATVRTNAALAKAELRPIDVPPGTQPCDVFGWVWRMGVYN
jgi:hypothetical protein